MTFKQTKTKIGMLAALLINVMAIGAETSNEGWIQLFNGTDIDDWIVKLNHHEMGDNFGDTFRVEDGLLKVRYDKYEEFGERFGHLYYKQPFSNYHLVVEYRFVGKLHEGAPQYADLNSGVMLHAQNPKTILKDQNWPIAVELQFLAGQPNNKPRATGNVCTPGTHIVYKGALTEKHVVQSTAETYPPGEWVRAEAIVDGSNRIVHIINGKKVLEYSQPQIGGGVIAGYDPDLFVLGKLLTEGFIGLQAEGQPIDFRKVELKLLQPDRRDKPLPTTTDQ
ncbi:hypothetical protein PDESU_00791 [Pontiella desulfatans]|uniref:3-keto-alpha-glucoside-1,2-lyase/3-keto-2-hydroxy-glucal hydratase domain-containing protein n=1 Tax=Pontiella desulfatans TaxID=2750659 RepID=A0A6C2TX44_PONDE|nr:DUF1080 domain-containing protein [Pontiella desulfatans]VGO12240.1 hypothetical protein PDESU_00791 [Pontiella desulfatans]